MPEIANCPVCGKKPGLAWDSLRCCGYSALTTDLWNRYAAAIELANAIAWREEIEPQIDWLGDRIYKQQTWFDLCKTLKAARADVASAEKRVLDVFN